MKNAGLAAVLSFFVSGLGQIYNGQIAKGLVVLVVQAVNGAVLTPFFIGSVILTPLAVISVPLWVVIWVWAIYDAYRVADRLNFRGSRRLW